MDAVGKIDPAPRAADIAGQGGQGVDAAHGVAAVGIALEPHADDDGGGRAVGVTFGQAANDILGNTGDFGGVCRCKGLQGFPERVET